MLIYVCFVHSHPIGRKIVLYEENMYENTFTFLNTRLFEAILPLQTNIVELGLESCLRFCLSLVVWSLFFHSPELKILRSL